MCVCVCVCVCVCIGLGITLRARGTALGSQLPLPFVDTGFALDVFVPVLQRVEAGDPAVSMGIYAAVMHSLGLLDGLGQLADASTDSVGQALANEFLPQRVRLKKTKEQP